MLGSGSPTDTDGWKHHCEFRFRKRLFEFGRPEKGSSGGVFRPPEQVLIVYDGSPASVALINLALHALTNTQQQSDTAAPLLPFPFRFSILVILGKREGLGRLQDADFEENANCELIYVFTHNKLFTVNRGCLSLNSS